MEDDSDDDGEEQLQRDIKAAITLSMFDAYRTGRHQDGAASAIHFPLSVPICQGSNLDASLGLGSSCSEIEKERGSPSPVPKIDDILPSLGTDVDFINLDNLSSSDSESMSPCPTQPVVAARIIKRGRSFEDSNIMAAKRQKIQSVRRCSVNSSSSQTLKIKTDIGHCGFHITRRQSRELSRILHGTPRDKGSIRHKLDPSIFDAEVSDNESESDFQLLPEEKEELESILEPRCLDITYNENLEFHYDELPDLEEWGEEEVDCKPEKCSDDRGVRLGKRSMRDVTPVLDKLQMQPKVKLIRIEDARPQINKKLKLKSLSDDSDSEAQRFDSLSQHSLTSSPQKSCTSPLSNFIWNQKHNRMLKSIVSKVGQDLSAAKCTSCVSESDSDTATHDLNDESLPNLTPLLIVEPLEEDLLCGNEPSRTAKSWYEESEVSDSEDDLDSEDEEERLRRREDAVANHTGLGRAVCTLPPADRPRPISPVTFCSRSSLNLEHPIHAMLMSHPGSEVSHPLDMHMADIIENSDIDDEKFQLRYFQICRSHMSGWIEWPEQIIQQLMQLLLMTDSPKVVRGAYDILGNILALNAPKYLPFDWETVVDVVDRLTLPYGVSNCKPSEIFGPAIALQYMVSAMEIELQYSAGRQSQHTGNCLSHKHLTKSKAFQWLSIDRGFHNIKQVIGWLISSISYGQNVPCSFARQDDSFAPLRHMPQIDDNTNQVTKDSTTHSDVPKVLGLFQRLLNLGIVVSRQRDVNIQRIISELVSRYMHMPLYFHRHLLVFSIKSPLVTFKLCQEVLENYGSNSTTYRLSRISFTLEDILEIYSCYVPPTTTTLTPPLTPTHLDTEEKDHPCPGKYSPAKVEELSFLMWSLVSSYIKVHNSDLEKQVLREMSAQVCNLESWYKSLTTEITSKTKLYLRMIESLGSARLS